MAESFELVVIGAGPAGYVAAIAAAQRGARVAVVEKRDVGGVCLNRGCIPSKAYLKTAKMIDQLPDYAGRGIRLQSAEFSVDMPTIVAEKNKVVATLRGGVETLFQSYDIPVYHGEARVHADKTVTVGDQVLEAEKVILATGSMPKKLDVPGGDSARILTSNELFDLEEVPKQLVVLGAGAIGLEMAFAFKSFGSDVTVVSHSPKLLKRMDADISREVEKIVKKKKIRLVKSAKIVSFTEKDDKIWLDLDGESIEADYILSGVGQEPSLEAIEGLDVALNRGNVAVDEYMQTSIPWLYAPGDINGWNMSAHAAYMMAEIAVNNALGFEKQSFAGKFIPTCIYTHPEVATMGLTEEEARAQQEITIGKFRLANNGRALAYGETQGFIKVIAGKEHGEVLGVHMVSDRAADLISEIAIIMQNELTVHEVIETIHAHPTFAEIITEASADALGRSVHLPKKK